MKTTMHHKSQTRRARAHRVLVRRIVLAGVLGLGAIANTKIVNAQVASKAGSRIYSTDLTNIAAKSNGGRVVNATSVLDDNAAFSANNLIDGKTYNATSKNSSNGWVSNKYDPINMESVTIGFADNATKNIGKIVLNPDAGVTPERWAKDVEVQVSTTTAQGPFRAVAQLTLKRSAERQEFLLLPAPARFVRLVFRSNWGSDRAVGLGEVEIYESISNTDPVGQLIGRLEGAVNDLKKFRDAQTEVNSAMNSGASTVSTTQPPHIVSSVEIKSGESSATYISASGKPVSMTQPHLVKTPDLKWVSASTTPVDTTNRVIMNGYNGAIDPALLQLVAGTSSTRTTANGRSINIASAANGGKIVASSSTFNNDPLYAPQNLIDGQNYSISSGKGTFGWASEGFTSGKESVTLGFRDDRTHVISRFVLNPTSNQNSLRWASRLEVQVTTGSPTDGPFRTVGTITLRPEAVNQDFTFRPVEAKYVRFLFVANGPGNPLPNGDPNVSSDRAVSLGEIEIYEPAASSGDLDSLIGRFNQVLIDLKRLRMQQQAGAAASAVGAETSEPAEATLTSTDGEASTP